MGKRRGRALLPSLRAGEKGKTPKTALPSNSPKASRYSLCEEFSKGLLFCTPRPAASLRKEGASGASHKKAALTEKPLQSRASFISTASLIQ